MNVFRDGLRHRFPPSSTSSAGRAAEFHLPLPGRWPVHGRCGLFAAGNGDAEDGGAARRAFGHHRHHAGTPACGVCDGWPVCLTTGGAPDAFQAVGDDLWPAATAALSHHRTVALVRARCRAMAAARRGANAGHFRSHRRCRCGGVDGNGHAHGARACARRWLGRTLHHAGMHRYGGRGSDSSNAHASAGTAWLCAAAFDRLRLSISVLALAAFHARTSRRASLSSTHGQLLELSA